MIKTLIGLILLLLPFLLLNRFKDKTKGFFYILFWLISLILSVSIFTQAIHLFRYPLILLFFIFLDIAILAYYYKKDINLKEFKDNIKKINIDWVLVFITIALIIELGSVHFNYSGKITTINEPFKEVNNARLIYPYYSDEWSAVSLTKYSINSGSLPFANPLQRNIYFPNYEFGFHTFVSGIFLILDLDPLTNYSILSLFFGLLICILVYYVLLFNEVEKITAGISALFVPFIANGVNLPGIWYLLPLTIGIVCLMLGFIFMAFDDKKTSLLMSFLVLIFYPPLFIFYTLGFFGILIKERNKVKVKYFLSYLLICIFIVIILSASLLFKESYNSLIHSVISKLFYMTFTSNAIPDYSIWKVIPIPILLLSFLVLLGTQILLHFL